MDYDSVKEVMRRFYRTTAIFNRTFSYPGFTLNEAVVLGVIVRHPGIIAHDISEYYAIDRGYLSKILKKLEANGLICRESQKRPPFEKLLFAAPSGEQTYREIEEIVDRSVDEHLSGLTEQELQEFLKSMSALLQSLYKVVPDYRDQNSGI